MDYRRIQLIFEGEVLDQMPNAGITWVPLPKISARVCSSGWQNFSCIFNVFFRATKPEPLIYPLKELEALDKGNGSVRYNIEEIFIHPLYVSE